MGGCARRFVRNHGGARAGASAGRNPDRNAGHDAGATIALR